MLRNGECTEEGGCEMNRKRRTVRRYFFLSAVLAAGLSGMGVTYAKWSDRLTVRGDFGTGIMDVVYSEEMPCMISLTDGDGAELGEKQEAKTRILENGKTMEITAPFPLNAEEFSENPDWMVKLEYPIKAGDGGTVNQAELSEADFGQEPEEELVLKPVRTALMASEDTEEYPLPENKAVNLDEELVFHVFRETREEGGTVLAVLYLKMSEESRELLSEFPTEVELEEEESELLPTQARLVVTYECSVPVYVEQGHENAAWLEQDEKRKNRSDDMSWTAGGDNDEQETGAWSGGSDGTVRQP